MELGQGYRIASGAGLMGKIGGAAPWVRLGETEAEGAVADVGIVKEAVGHAQHAIVGGGLLNNHLSKAYFRDLKILRSYAAIFPEITVHRIAYVISHVNNSGPAFGELLATRV